METNQSINHFCLLLNTKILLFHCHILIQGVVEMRQFTSEVEKVCSDLYNNEERHLKSPLSNPLSEIWRYEQNETWILSLASSKVQGCFLKMKFFWDSESEICNLAAQWDSKERVLIRQHDTFISTEKKQATD